MKIEIMLDAFNTDLQLDDVSIDAEVTNSRRILAALCIGTEPVAAYRAALRVKQVLVGLSQDREALSDLVALLDEPGADFERALYFAQAGRGVGTAITDLDWILPMLDARVVILDKMAKQGLRSKRGVRALSRREVGLQLKVDLKRTRLASSVTYWGGKDAPLSEMDRPLFALSLDPKSLPLVRAMAGLCVGMGLDDGGLATQELFEAVKEFWSSKTYVGSRLSAILANECDDFQRALFFATVGRARPLVRASFELVLEALGERGRIWRKAKLADEKLQPLVSPYVVAAKPEACVFDLGFVPEDRERFLHGEN
jgi:hypothetical protein